MGRLVGFFGFDPSVSEERACFAPAVALSLALAALPFLLHVEVDTDRAVPLAFLPAVWLGWKITKPARQIDAWLLLWIAVAMLVSTALAAHAARALVMIAAVGWTLAGAFVARNLAACAPAVRLVLAGIAVGAVAGGVMVRFGAGAEQMYFPTYWSARLFGAHQFAGCVATLGILVIAPPNQRSLRILTVLAAIVIWTGFAWSGSRAPAVGLAVALALWLWRGSTPERRRLMLWVPGLSIVALALSYPLGIPYPQLGWWDAFERTARAASIEVASSERSRFWAVVWQEIARSPWIGHGADSYLYIHPAQNGNQPHNVVLQWLLEYGLLGAVPLMILVGRGISGLRTQAVTPSDTRRPYRIWASASLAGGLVYALFDGVFYHMIVFMPVAVIAGVALGQNPQPGQAGVANRVRALGRSALLACLAILLLHNCLHVMQLKARNVGPDSAPARILRAFPSTTHALRNWIDAWRQTQPEVAMEWIKWAQDASIHQGAFHVYAAQIYIWKKDFKAAEAEMLRCLEKVHHLERADVLDALANVRKRAAGQESHRAPPAAEPVPTLAPTLDAR